MNTQRMIGALPDHPQLSDWIAFLSLGGVLLSVDFEKKWETHVPMEHTHLLVAQGIRQGVGTPLAL